MALQLMSCVDGRNARTTSCRMDNSASRELQLVPKGTKPIFEQRLGNPMLCSLVQKKTTLHSLLDVA